MHGEPGTGSSTDSHAPLPPFIAKRTATSAGDARAVTPLPPYSGSGYESPGLGAAGSADMAPPGLASPIEEPELAEAGVSDMVDDAGPSTVELSPPTPIEDLVLGADTDVERMPWEEGAPDLSTEPLPPVRPEERMPWEEEGAGAAPSGVADEERMPWEEGETAPAPLEEELPEVPVESLLVPEEDLVESVEVVAEAPEPSAEWAEPPLATAEPPAEMAEPPAELVEATAPTAEPPAETAEPPAELAEATAPTAEAPGEEFPPPMEAVGPSVGAAEVPTEVEPEEVPAEVEGIPTSPTTLLAERLEALAGILREEGAAALTARLSSEDRFEALLASLLMGYLTGLGE